jgi:predicted lipoprotein
MIAYQHLIRMPWKRLLKIVLLVIAGLIALRLAFYIEPLDKHREALLLETFSPEQLVTYHWGKDLNQTLHKALPIEHIAALTPEDGLVTDIGGKVHYLLKGTSTITALTDQFIVLALPDNRQGRLPVKHLFGNTAVASTGWFQANDFANTMDYNAASASLNKRLLEKVVQPLLDCLCVGDRLVWVGAVALDPGQSLSATLDIVPFSLVKSADSTSPQ